MILPGYESEIVDYRICNGCNLSLPLNETYFRIDNSYITKIKYRSICRKCEIKKHNQLKKIKKENKMSQKPDCCLLCGIKTEKLVIDHCHKTGVFRGWLCNTCNSMLGMTHDNAELYMKMSLYIMIHNKKEYDDETIDACFYNSINKFFKKVSSEYRDYGKGLSAFFGE
jgi:hypothetical protein